MMIENEEKLCGAERPRNEYDTCILPLDHEGDMHEDAAGNEWSVNFHDWSSVNDETYVI